MAENELDLILATVDDTEFGDDDWNAVYLAIQSLSAQWRNIGIALGIRKETLAEIEENYSRATDYLSSVLTAWINQNYDTKAYSVPSWKTLCVALSNVSDKKKFIKDLAMKHGGKVPNGGGRGATAASSNEEKLLSDTPKIGDFNLIKYKGKDGSEKKLRILSRASRKWREIAGEFFDEQNLVDNLDDKHRGDSTACLRAVFSEFLSRHLANNYTRDWKGIIRVFDDLDDEALAKEVKEAILNRI